LTEDRLPFTTSTAEAKERVLRRTIENENVVAFYRPRRLFLKLAAAASISILLVLSVAIFGSEKIRNEGKTVQAYSLPDGSRVYLNAGAEISYNDFTWSLTRNLDFSGSAFFDVNKGKTFSVITDQGVVSVLGTSFSVLSTDKKLKVACKTGKVLVENENSSSTLTPGEGVRMGTDYTDNFLMKTDLIDAWVGGTYHFDNVSIEDVFNSIEDFSNYDIDYPEGLASNYSGEFSTAQPVEEIMDIVCQPVGLTYEIIEEKNLIIIK